MDTDLPVTLSPAFLKVTRIRGQACPRVCAPNLPRSATPSSSGRWATRAARSALRVVPAAGTVPAPLPPRALRPAPGPPRSAPLAPPLRRAVQSLGSSGGSRGSSRSPSGLHGNAASQARNSEPTASAERGWPSWSALRGNNLAGRPEGKQQCGDCWSCGTARLSKYCPRRTRSPSIPLENTLKETSCLSLSPEFCIPEIPSNYLDKTDVQASKSRQNGRLLLYDPKEKLMSGANKEKSHKAPFGRRPRLSNKLYTSPAQIPGGANAFSAKKEASSKKSEDKVSFKSIENRPSSRSTENKDVLTNQQSGLWSSSFLKESAGETSKDLVLAKQEGNSDYCLKDIEENLSDSTDGDGEEDSSNDDDEGPTKKATQAPLELMAEFLRAEMGRDYQLAKKLCQMILIYEPENPVAKEFFSLIEEILLKEKAQDEEDEEDSDEDSSSESEVDSSEDGSEDSSDECEDGS
ncbi:glutamate-rich protein 2 [Mus musculus]|uniref:Glutamate rich 2 n=2 Tax=Mus musculus TaxID=10090 RepID=E9Q1A6_MOUSE|nr:glutamate-rich protein 2 [Mus musculus]|eukprot:NP_080020.2 glutamate-rich protein 2 [Mus musculus]